VEPTNPLHPLGPCAPDRKWCGRRGEAGWIRADFIASAVV